MIDSVPIAALQHFAFCPRQCAYIHVECAWDANFFTAKGDQLHERVHSNEAESRGNTRTERGVQVCSEKYGIAGKLDLLEITSEPFSLTPVEYKRGKPKVSDCDRVQLCAQVLCLEEMRHVQIDNAALWYWQVRKREWVDINAGLRAETIKVVEQSRQLLASGVMPKAVYKPSCKPCSFYDRCQPQMKDNSTAYVKQLFADHEETAE